MKKTLITARLAAASLKDARPIGAGLTAAPTSTAIRAAEHVSALCRDKDAELWFHNSEPQRRKANAICKRYPARQVCLQHALDRKIKHGIWGGRDEEQRHKMINPAKPRKPRRISQPSDKTSEVRGVSWNPTSSGGPC